MATPYDHSAFYPGAVEAGDVVLVYRAPRAVVLTGGDGAVDTAPSSGIALAAQIDGVPTADVAVAVTVGGAVQVTITEGFVLSAGQTLRLLAPADPLGLAGLGVTISGEVQENEPPLTDPAYDVSAYYPGRLLRSHPVLRFTAVRTHHVTGLRMTVGACATTEVVLPVKVNGVGVGSLTVVPGSATLLGLPLALTAGDELEIDAPDGEGYADATLADLSITLVGLLGAPVGGEAASSSASWECPDTDEPCPDPDPELAGVMAQEDLFREAGGVRVGNDFQMRVVARVAAQQKWRVSYRPSGSDPETEWTTTAWSAAGASEMLVPDLDPDVLEWELVVEADGGGDESPAFASEVHYFTTQTAYGSTPPTTPAWTEPAYTIDGDDVVWTWTQVADVLGYFWRRGAEGGPYTDDIQEVLVADLADPSAPEYRHVGGKALLPYAAVISAFAEVE